MSYIVIKIVKGRRYRYEQMTWREGKRVRTKSRYIGPAGVGMRAAKGKRLLRKAGAFIKAQGPITNGLARYEDLAAKQTLAEEAAFKHAREQALAELHDQFGLKMGPPTPIPEDKSVPSIDLAGAPASAARSTSESPSGVEGQGDTDAVSAGVASE